MNECMSKRFALQMQLQAVPILWVIGKLGVNLQSSDNWTPYFALSYQFIFIVAYRTAGFSGRATREVRYQVFASAKWSARSAAQTKPRRSVWSWQDFAVRI